MNGIERKIFMMGLMRQINVITRVFLCLFISVNFFLSCTGSGKNNETASDYLCVMTYNIHHGAGVDGKLDLHRIGELIKENDPDLVALQEVDVGTERIGGLHTMEYLARELSMFMAFGKNLEFQGGEYGNGILSKYPLHSIENFHIPPYDSGEQRGILKVVIDYKGQKLAFWNTHFDHREDDTERRESVRLIQTMIQQTDIPVILAGDFNDTPESTALSELKTLFEDTWSTVKNDKGFTFPANDPERRIDYVFIINSAYSFFMLKPEEARVISSPASDHLPLIVTFLIQDK
jgi:endonuclease/exonuclease/phosphatase family metal-dependent hydrolase